MQRLHELYNHKLSHSDASFRGLHDADGCRIAPGERRHGPRVGKGHAGFDSFPEFKGRKTLLIRTGGRGGGYGVTVVAGPCVIGDFFGKFF